MPRFDWRIARNVLLVFCLLTAPGAGANDPPRPGKVLDEARQAGRGAASLPAAGGGLFPRHGWRRRSEA